MEWGFLRQGKWWNILVVFRNETVIIFYYKKTHPQPLLLEGRGRGLLWAR